jgi:hypothetical protein
MRSLAQVPENQADGGWRHAGLRFILCTAALSSLGETWPPRGSYAPAISALARLWLRC